MCRLRSHCRGALRKFCVLTLLQFHGNTSSITAKLCLVSTQNLLANRSCSIIRYCLYNLPFLHTPETRLQPNAQPGDLRFVDYNGDGKIDNNDRQDVGSAFPKVNLGVSLGAEWKGLDLNMFFDGNFGNKIYNAQYYSTVYNESTGNQYAERMNSWTENNHSDIPRCLFGTSDPNGTNWGYTDRWLENGSFLRLKTLELGYTLPKVWVSKAGLQNVRVYTAMENLFTITDYKGYTPDLGMVDADGAGTSGGSGVMTRGCDDGRYPMARTITFGLQVNF